MHQFIFTFLEAILYVWLILTELLVNQSPLGNFKKIYKQYFQSLSLAFSVWLMFFPQET